MSRFHSYLNTSASLVGAYTGDQPLHLYLKQYFSQNKKHGSRDRRLIATCCYSYFRMGHALKELDIRDRMRAGLFLCHDAPGEWAVLFEEDWLDRWKGDIEGRMNFLGDKYPSFSSADIFPWADAISTGIDREAFIRSHLVRPDVFLRIRPGNKESVEGSLKSAGVAFCRLTESCLSVASETRLDTVVKLDKEAVIQDYSSQRMADFFPEGAKTVWDCCAASGGKSILAVDALPGIELTVSDVRPAILQNLAKRFRAAGIARYRPVVRDLAGEEAPPEKNIAMFDLVICDAPCSGSGTWARNPEQLYYFTKEKMEHYAALQQRITQHAVSCVAGGGYFLYITCSVLKAENEAIVSQLMDRFPLECIRSGSVTGYEHRADTMYAALLRKK